MKQASPYTPMAANHMTPEEFYAIAIALKSDKTGACKATLCQTAIFRASPSECRGSLAYGQATTGSISGQVQSSDGQELPGVTIAVTSPMLQGTRTAVASESGDYLFPLLPPGTYAVAFELAGFQTVTRTQQVASGYNARVDATMSVSRGRRIGHGRRR